MIQIPIEKRHNECQTLVDGLVCLSATEELKLQLLAIIADRLTDIADELKRRRE